MKRTTLLVVALAAFLAATGVAIAAPGSTATADTGGSATAADAANDGAAADRVGSNAAAQAGPPGELPEPVPDFVSDVHGLIGQFLDGSLDSLGPAVSDAAGNDDASDGDGASEETASSS